MQKKQPSNVSNKEVGFVIGAVALAAIAGTYFLYGSSNSPRNRAKVKGWALKAKGEVLEKLESLKEANEEKYHSVVDGVMKKYSQMKAIDTTEVEALGKDLKKHWKNFQKDLQKGKIKSKKVAPNITK